MRLLLNWLLSALALLIVSLFVPGFHVDGLLPALIAAVVIGLLNATVGLLLKIITIPLSILTLGIFLLVINGVMILLASAVVPGFHVSGLGPAFWGAVVLALLGMLIRAIVKDAYSEGFTAMGLIQCVGLRCGLARRPRLAARIRGSLGSSGRLLRCLCLRQTCPGRFVSLCGFARLCRLWCRGSGQRQRRAHRASSRESAWRWHPRRHNDHLRRVILLHAGINAPASASYHKDNRCRGRSAHPATLGANGPRPGENTAAAWCGFQGRIHTVFKTIGRR